MTALPLFYIGTEAVGREFGLLAALVGSMQDKQSSHEDPLLSAGNVRALQPQDNRRQHHLLTIP